MRWLEKALVGFYPIIIVSPIATTESSSYSAAVEVGNLLPKEPHGLSMGKREEVVPNT